MLYMCVSLCIKYTLALDLCLQLKLFTSYTSLAGYVSYELRTCTASYILSIAGIDSAIGADGHIRESDSLGSRQQLEESDREIHSFPLQLPFPDWLTDWLIDWAGGGEAAALKWLFLFFAEPASSAPKAPAELWWLSKQQQPSENEKEEVNPAKKKHCQI